jgi:hypothetical protein
MKPDIFPLITHSFLIYFPINKDAFYNIFQIKLKKLFKIDLRKAKKMKNLLLIVSILILAHKSLSLQFYKQKGFGEPCTNRKAWDKVVLRTDKDHDHLNMAQNILKIQYQNGMKLNIWNFLLTVQGTMEKT